MNNKIPSLEGFSVLITGGTRGIGKATVAKLSEAGANVLFCYLSSNSDAVKIVDEMEDNVGIVIAKKADIRKEKQIRELVQYAHKRFGKIDVLINNAHQAYDRMPFEKTSWSEFEREFETLVRAPYLFTQYCLPYMKDSGGCIINIGSTMAEHPLEEHSFYVTAKNALMGLTRSLALELGKYGIRVNLITPGPLETDHNAGLPKLLMEELASKTPLNKEMGNCQQVADAIFLLTLPESSLITGSNIQVSGGFSIF